MDAHENPKDQQTHRIIGAAMAIHGELGRGFLETVYHHALAHEMTLRAIPFAREVPIPVHYKDIMLDCSYRADFLCFDEIIVELKANLQLTRIDEAQTINYLKACGLHRALLLNFGTDRLEFRRLVFNLRPSASSAANSLSSTC